MGLDSVDLHYTGRLSKCHTVKYRSGIARVSSLHTLDSIVYWSFEVADKWFRVSVRARARGYTFSFFVKILQLLVRP